MGLLFFRAFSPLVAGTGMVCLVSLLTSDAILRCVIGVPLVIGVLAWFDRNLSKMTVK